MTLTIAAVLTLQAGVLFAGVDNDEVNASTPVTIPNIAALAPVTPAEAVFEDIIPAVNDISVLAPVMPAEADFTDTPSVIVVDPSDLAPMTPAEADFDDAIGVSVGFIAFAPVPPVEADFE